MSVPLVIGLLKNQAPTVIESAEKCFGDDNCSSMLRYQQACECQ